MTELLQLLLNGLLAGTQLAVPAIGFTTIYAVLRFPNFAVASFATIGAYAGFVANAWLGLPAPLALLAAFLVAGVGGVVADEVVLRRLRPSGPLAVAIASVALTIVLENVVRFSFGNELRGYDLPVLRDWRAAGLRIGPQQLYNALAAGLAMAALFLFLARTRTGKMMRAVADNPMLASLKGINAEVVARLANFLGMGLAGFGGMLIALDTSIDPLTGFRVMLSVFAAAVVGGLGSIPGAVAGAFVVGVGEEFSLLLLDPSYRTAVGFLAILLVLSLRPRGLLGERAY
ncbi:MAG TPA: branched-chain amino acid ABC transporter permease [Acetobacteraceae bacterium]